MLGLDNEPLYVFVVIVCFLPVSFFAVLTKKNVYISVALTAGTTNTLQLSILDENLPWDDERTQVNIPCGWEFSERHSRQSCRSLLYLDPPLLSRSILEH